MEPLLMETEYEKPLVLVVDDDPTNLRILVSKLNREYRLGVAKSGTKALEYMGKQIPDLVLLDVMMPDMDGYAVCEHIKRDPRLCDIPVVFISYVDDPSQKTRGFEVGGVDYITKPFHMRALILKVRNIIASREKLKDLYGQRLSLENLGVEISGGDDKFLQQLNEAIDRDIADPALNLDTLCRRIGLSRASLYRKLMSATGLSPARYIQSVRLNLAARMLRETQMSVSEIATASGFNSLIHFSASFRKQYGVPPSRYAAGQEATGPEAAPGRENEPQE